VIDYRHTLLSKAGWRGCKCGCGYWTHPDKRYWGWRYVDDAFRLEAAEQVGSVIFLLLSSVIFCLLSPLSGQLSGLT
jgi:hypothetical protein